MRNIFGAFILLMVALLTACEILTPENKNIIQSKLSQDTAPDVSSDQTQTLVNGNNSFAFDFYNQAHKVDGNLVFSPYSITLATAMLYGGASGETAEQIASTLHFTLPSGQFHPAMNTLSLDLAQRSTQSKKVDKKNPMRLNISNSVWGQRGYSFESSYLDLLAINYGAGIHLVDFSTAPDAAREQINDWVSEETEGKIKDILSPDSIDPYTRLILANAIYFKAAWQEAFVEKLTRESAFTLLDGTRIQVPTMQTENSIPLRIGNGEGYQAVALPYKGDLAEMIIILPDQGMFESIEDNLDFSRFTEIVKDMFPSSSILYMPRFEFTTDINLKNLLSEMGMPLAFDEMNADFSSMTKTERLYVDQALHSAYILVNEEGTEAAAATIFGMKPASLPMELHIDRPFIYCILDKPTGTILFMGRVLNPLNP